MTKYLRFKDSLFFAIIHISSFISVLIFISFLGMLAYDSIGFFEHVSIFSFLTDTVWAPSAKHPRFGIICLLSATGSITIISLLVAIPISTIVSVYMSEFCSIKTKNILKIVIDLISAVPSIAFACFSIYIITPCLRGINSSIPLFNMLSAGIAIGLMLIPNLVSMLDDVMYDVPMILREASYALGADKLTTAINVVLPAAKVGMISSYLFAFSRAMGETTVVAISAGTISRLSFNPLGPGQTITGYILQVITGEVERGSLIYNSIFAAGALLMILTLCINISAHVLSKSAIRLQ